jgi:lipopolysaccharide/colanic/teichoic acid biosynthesis glycosyltransferase
MVLKNETGDQDGFAGESPVALWELTARLAEVVLCVASLALLAPVLLLAAVAIKLDSGGPIAVREARCGHRNRRIGVYKFRVATGSAGPPRLTLLGQFLRQTGIEDLPMLVNVMRGEMSIVGPPPSTYPAASLNERKPGMTRWADLFSSQNGGSH